MKKFILVALLALAVLLSSTAFAQNGGTGAGKLKHRRHTGYYHHTRCYYHTGYYYRNGHRHYGYHRHLVRKYTANAAGK